MLCDDFEQYGEFPILAELRNLFIQTAEGMRHSGEEFIHAPEWLDIYWPPGEYAFIKLCVEDKLKALYEEAEQVLSLYLYQKNVSVPINLLREAMVLNRALIKTPFQTEDIKLTFIHNIWDIYKAIRIGENLPLAQGRYNYTIDRTTEKWSSWEEWYEKMVWWSNRQGAYLYGNKNPLPDLAGHH